MSLPLRTEFNHALVIDHKVWKKDKMLILHLTDNAAKFAIWCCNYNKSPPVTADKIMLLWIGSSSGLAK